MTNFTKVRYEDLDQTLQDFLDDLSAHTHDGVDLPGGGTSYPGGGRVSFLDLLNIPDEIINNPATLILNEIPTGTVDGINAVFVLANFVLDNDKEAVYVQGIRQAPGDDYTLLNDTITFIAGHEPPAGSKILVDYQPVI